MRISKINLAGCLLLILTGIAGLGALVQEAPADENSVVLAQATNNPKAKKSIEVVSPQNGILLAVGEKDKKLKAGDRVEAGQVIARLDDRLSQIDLERARCKVRVAQLELEASKKVLAEAETRYELLLRLTKVRNMDIGQEEIRGKKLAVERFQLEVNIKKEVVNLALFDVRTAETVLDMHVIRSPVRGVIRTIYKKTGEGIKSLEPILEIVAD
jgi:multidrug efflux pump subunit AcrA (membrane-fusion protein)